MIAIQIIFVLFVALAIGFFVVWLLDALEQDRLERERYRRYWDAVRQREEARKWRR